MNGAIAELFASTSSTPNRTSVMTIGASQYFLFSFMNCQSSRTTCTFDIATPQNILMMLFIQVQECSAAIEKRKADRQVAPAFLNGSLIYHSRSRRHARLGSPTRHLRLDPGISTR